MYIGSNWSLHSAKASLLLFCYLVICGFFTSPPCPQGDTGKAQVAMENTLKRVL